MAACSARAGANKESDGSDTPVPLVIDADGTAAEAAKSISLAMEGDDSCGISSIAAEVKTLKENLRDVGCTAGLRCSWLFPIAAWSARVGANKESDGDTPVTVIDAGTAADVGKPISTAAASTEAPSMSQIVN